MTSYTERLRALVSEKRANGSLPKLPKPGFVSFGSTSQGRFQHDIDPDPGIESVQASASAPAKRANGSLPKLTKPSPQAPADRLRDNHDARLRALTAQGLDADRARRLAHEAAMVDQLDAMPTQSPYGKCLGCDEGTDAGDLVPFGLEPDVAWLHARCAPGWRLARRERASEALAAAGIHRPD